MGNRQEFADAIMDDDNKICAVRLDRQMILGVMPASMFASEDEFDAYTSAISDRVTGLMVDLQFGEFKSLEKEAKDEG